MPARQESTAKREGYKLIGDQELLNGVEGRARQLEAEIAGNMLFRDEAEAVGEEQTVQAHNDTIAQLRKRLEVVHARRDALKANMPKTDTEAPVTA